MSGEPRAGASAASPARAVPMLTPPAETRRHGLLFALLFALTLALVPLLGGAFAVDFVTKIMILAIFALSLELLVGQTGLVSFGHAAFFGIGGYAAVRWSSVANDASLWWLAPAAIASAALYALLVGALSLRTRGVYFIMVTLAFAQMAYYVAHDTPLGGGSDGIYLTARPSLAIAGVKLLAIERAVPLYYAVLLLLVLVFAFLARLLRSPFGRALAGIRSNEQRMRALGFSTLHYQLAAFVLSGALAGLAGCLFALKDGVVNPELLAWHQSGAVLIMIILGGLGSLAGAVLGAFAYVGLQELFQSQLLFGEFAKHWQLGVGVTIIFCVLLLPRGLIGVAAIRRSRRPIPAHAAHAANTAHGTRAGAPTAPHEIE